MTTSPSTDNPLILEVADLSKHFATQRGVVGTLRGAPQRVVRAVDGVSFELMRGEVLALVGESGCGKTTTAMSVIGLTEPSGGVIRIDGIPPGTWTVTMWHEGFRSRGTDKDGRPVYEEPRTVSQEITIAPRATAAIEFELK